MPVELCEDAAHTHVDVLQPAVELRTAQPSTRASTPADSLRAGVQVRTQPARWSLATATTQHSLPRQHVRCGMSKAPSSVGGLGRRQCGWYETML